MPPLPTIVNSQHQHGTTSALRNQCSFNYGSNPILSPNAGFKSVAAAGGEHGSNPNPSPNLSPGASFEFRGGSNDGLGGFNVPGPSTLSTGSDF